MSDPRRTVLPATVTSLIRGLDEDLRRGGSEDFERVPTGFVAFDNAIGGGLRPGDLTVLAGPPGIGKTVFGLQLARHVGQRSHPAVVVCYEHSQVAMLLRLLSQETGREDARGRAIGSLSERLRIAARNGEGLADVVRGEPVLHQAVLNLGDIGDDLVLVGGSVRDTDLAVLDDLVADAVERADRMPILVVDYLQKVPTEDRHAPDRSRRVVEGLKDLAMHHHIPVVALASLSIVGLSARRLRLAHLDETSAIAFEADIVVLLANKVDAIAKAHLAYGGTTTRDYENWVVWTIEKNRAGPNPVNLEFEKDFAHFRFLPTGRRVSERLADDRLGGDAN